MRILALVAAAALLSGAMSAQSTCKFERIDPSCGPNLKGSVQVQHRSNVVTFAVSDAPKNAHGVLAFGVKEIKLHFPGTKCFLLIAPLALIAFNTNAHGTAQKSVDVPGHVSFTILSRAGHDNKGSIVTSNALRLTCK